jgi:nitroreductase
MIRCMGMNDLVSRSRTYRRFDGSARIGIDTLRDLVSLARCTPSAANRQPLKYVLSCAPEWNAKIFETLAWAAYLKDWPGPDAPERPTAYMVVLLDTRITPSAEIDVGIAAQTIMLGAAERGLGGCMLANIRREDLAARLELPSHFSIPLVIALGKPVERVVLEDLPLDSSIKYYRDAARVHHVPKRPLEELIFARYS